MKQAEIITLVLTSSVFSAALTSFVNWFLQRNNYRNDYYKKLLDKRLEVFELAHNVSVELAGSYELSDRRLCIAPFAFGKEKFSKFYLQIFKVIENGFWLSKETNEKLTQLNNFLLNNVDSKLNKSTDFEKDLIELGVKCRNDLKIIKNDLDELLKKDLVTLHEIEKFLK